ncbi:membrane protein [Actinocatenispora thailandica]|uniref:Membrane protein n=1 Tax=Actinocatenispora thailandica TaxID=227318 RepID=A0A7R7DS49_9ACTN|nr:anthrone oxygenase family protein [Actinocatenispora thailandica]BCJ36865.1 membrane protein [Actinocatenispora thailandica]
MLVAREVTLGLATLGFGLMAGLFYAFAVAVMPALRGADDRTFVDVMQRINRAILNGWFLLVFVGVLLPVVAAAALHLPAGARPALPWVLAGLLLYLVMFLITGRVNVPLNDRLAAAGDPARLAEPAAVREAFEAVWVRWNLVRAVTATAAFGCLVLALVRSAGAS